MTTAARLALFLAILAGVFVLALAVGSAVDPTPLGAGDGHGMETR